MRRLALTLVAAAGLAAIGPAALRQTPRSLRADVRWLSGLRPHSRARPRDWPTKTRPSSGSASCRSEPGDPLGEGAGQSAGPLEDRGAETVKIPGPGCMRRSHRRDHWLVRPGNLGRWLRWTVPSTRPRPRGSDGERARHICAVRAAADRTADPGGARRQACRGSQVGSAINNPPAVAARIRLRERARGATLRQIADRLNSDGIPTARGGWQSLKNRRQPSPPETKNPAYAGLLRTAGAGFEPATFGL